MKTLKLDDEFFGLIEQERKTSTIRLITDENKNDDYPRDSYLRFLSCKKGSFKSATVQILSTRNIKYSEITEEVCTPEGFINIKDLKDNLKKYYSGISEDSDLRVIDFRLHRPNDDIQIVYEGIAQETFDKAIVEIERDLGWGSWTDDFPDEVWTLLETKRECLDKKVGVEIVDSNRESQTITVRIPAKNIDWQYNGVSALLSLVAGGVLGSSGVGKDMRVRSVNLSPSIRTQFSGPTLGICGIRKLCKVYDRPIVTFTVKPRLGLDDDQFTRLCVEVAKGGVDIIEDDERLSNQEYSRLIDRAGKTINALNNLDTLYSANISGRADKIVYVAEELIKIGVKLLKIDVLPVGFSGLQAVAEWLQSNNKEVGITVYPAMNKLFERGMSRNFILDLCRLCGADMVYAGIPTFQESVNRSQDSALFYKTAEYHRLLKREDGIHKQVLPTISTNITPLNAAAYTRLLGKNVGFFVGAGIVAYGGGPKAGAELLMKTIEDAARNIDEDTTEVKDKFFNNQDDKDYEQALNNCIGFGELVKYSGVPSDIKKVFRNIKYL